MADSDSLRPDDPMRFSGAVWCEQHGKWECSKNSKRSQARCHQPAIGGTATCRMHPGKSRELAKAQGQANLAAWATIGVEGVQAMDPGQVVLDQMRLAVIRADLYGQRLQAAYDSEGLTAVVGVTYAIAAGGKQVETGERIRGLAHEEGVWRDRAVRYAKTAHDMGIDERRIELEEGQASQVVAAAMAGIQAAALAAEARELFLEAFLAFLEPSASVVAGEVAS